MDYESFKEKFPKALKEEMADRYEQRQHEAEHDRKDDKDSILGDLKEKKQEIAKKDSVKDAALKAGSKKHETSL